MGFDKAQLPAPSASMSEALDPLRHVAESEGRCPAQAMHARHPPTSYTTKRKPLMDH